MKDSPTCAKYRTGVASGCEEHVMKRERSCQHRYEWGKKRGNNAEEKKGMKKGLRCEAATATQQMAGKERR